VAVLKNRAKMSTSTTGTGTITLGSAESGYQSFADAGVANADVVRYVIEDGSNFEIGTGTYTSSGTLLSRTVSESSNSNNAINLSGSATVFIGATAEDILSDVVDDTTPQLGGNLDVQAREITTSTTNGNVKLTPNGTGVVEVKGAGGNDGTLQLNCSANSHGVKIKSPPHSAAASYTLTLPDDDGAASEFLQTDGSGNLSWAAASGGGGGASLQTTEALVNGDLVSLNSTGTVSKTSLGGNLSAGSSTTVTTSGNGYMLNSTVATDGNGTFVTVYRGNNSYSYAVAHTVAGTTITTGTPVVLRSSAQQDASAIIYDADQQKYLVVCPFSDYSQAFVISVSGTTITASSSTNLPQKGSGWAGDYDASQNKGVFLYNRSSDSDPYVIAATISGTSVSFNTPALVQNIGYAYIHELSYNSTAQKSVAFYTDDTGNVAYANAIGLSGSTFTIGSAVTVATGDKGYSFSIHGQSAVGFIYRDRANNLEAKARVGSISGTTITLGTEVEVGSGRSDYNWGFYDSGSGKIIFGFEDTNPPKIRPATLSGTTITLGTATTLSTGVSGYLADKRVSKNASGVFMVQFQSYSPNGIHVIALEVSSPNIDDFIGIAGATIAANATGTINTLSDINTGQSSLTIGSKYYLQADGTLGTTVVVGKEAGIALSTTDLLITYDPSATAGENVGSLVNNGSAGAIDLSSGNVFSDTPAANVTYAFNNPPASGTAYGFTLKIAPTATATVTWPSSVDWAGGSAPDAPASGETDIFTFYTQDGGTTYYGFQAGNAMG